MQWIQQEGLTVERSAPYTPQQNGAAERSGGVIIAKARTMRIEAHLPEEVWPEPVKATRYLVNRTPSNQLNWKTLLEILQVAIGISNPCLSIIHLHIYSCYAYPVI